jgi:hypothetical protein
VLTAAPWLSRCGGSRRGGTVAAAGRKIASAAPKTSATATSSVTLGRQPATAAAISATAPRSRSLPIIRRRLSCRSTIVPPNSRNASRGTAETARIAPAAEGDVSRTADQDRATYQTWSPSTEIAWPPT